MSDSVTNLLFKEHLVLMYQLYYAMLSYGKRAKLTIFTHYLGIWNLALLPIVG